METSVPVAPAASRKAITIAIEVGSSASATQRLEQLREVVEQLEQNGHTVLSFHIGPYYE